MGIFDGFPPEGSNPPPKRSKRDRIERLRRRLRATQQTEQEAITSLRDILKGTLDLLEDEL